MNPNNQHPSPVPPPQGGDGGGYSELLNAIALTQTKPFQLSALVQLYREMGSATAIVENRHRLKELVPDIQPRLLAALQNLDEPMKRAEIELEFDLKHHIRPLCLADPNYPQRLKECDDAPLVLYYCGNADLNQRYVINIIGTRHCTAYGQDLIRRFVADLKAVCPQVLIVSGLAYGIDICAHRQALANGYETVGVLAHGLDDLYPAAHRDTAVQMVGHGGLLTEFPTQTQPIPQNFVQRNRIVAGMSDACILVESAAKGGGLITASISRSYNRDVFAFPGRIGDKVSEGCNNLIRNNGAALITSAQDFVLAMGWQTDSLLAQAQQQGIERTLFPNLSPTEQAIVNVLKTNNDLQVNMLSVQSNIPVARLTASLFELEMKGVVKMLAGGTYHLLM